jgi:hypothetical protein
MNKAVSVMPSGKDMHIADLEVRLKRAEDEARRHEADANHLRHLIGLHRTMIDSVLGRMTRP